MMITLKAIEISATLIVIIGVYLIAKPSIRGHYLMLAAQGLWFTLALHSNLPYLATQSIVLALLEVRAIYNWKVKKIGI